MLFQSKICGAHDYISRSRKTIFSRVNEKARCVEIAGLIDRCFSFVLQVRARSKPTSDQCCVEWRREWRYLSVIRDCSFAREMNEWSDRGDPWYAMRPKSCSLFLLFCVLLPGVVRPFTSGEGKLKRIKSRNYICKILVCVSVYIYMESCAMLSRKTSG